MWHGSGQDNLLSPQSRRLLAVVELDLCEQRPSTAGEVERSLASLAARDQAFGARVHRLARVAAGSLPIADYLAEHGVAGVRRFLSAAGTPVLLLPAESFPGHQTNIYLVDHPSRRVLIDAGSSLPSTRKDLDLAARALRSAHGLASALADVDWLLVTHGHLDHFGGLTHLRRPGLAVAVHELDARVLCQFEQRSAIIASAMHAFFARAGVPPALRPELEQAHAFAAGLFRSTTVERRLVDGDQVEGCAVHHAPGHSPGQVCVQVDDLLLTADHVLARTTAFQPPESITPGTGLDHYLPALQKIRHLPGISLALPGHEEPIPDLGARIDAIAELHRQRLARVLAICRQPSTVHGVAGALFGEVAGFDRILALEEAAAHVEYLAQRGLLELANLDDLAAGEQPSLLYVTPAAGARAGASLPRGPEEPGEGDV
jgi:glyoxylase-like metal-dependent hydrolase (beta-lactamase superfamily II)